MLIMRHTQILLLFSLMFSFLAVSCSETKVSQCEKIIVVTKKIAQESEAYRQSQDIKKILEIADTFDAYGKTMDSLQLKDPQLVNYQKGLAEVYRGNAQATRNFIEALKAKNIVNARLMQKEVQRIGKTEQELVSGMNEYCQGN